MSVEGHGRSRRGSGSSVGGQGGVIGDHLEVRCSLPKAMSISRSEIFRKQEHKVSYRCSLPSPLQRRSKDQRIALVPAEDLLGFSVAHEL